MKELKGSKTEQNLLTAFAGESQARNKYSYYASKAKKEGLNKIRRARTMLDELGYSHVPVEVDGNCSLANIPKMAAMGAEVFVVGSSQ